MSAERYDLDSLLQLMARLRDPHDGCPWDREQTFATIAPFTLEEVYELVDAIENADLKQVKEELGDVLFQVVFYAQLGQEQQAFSFADIVSEITRKLIRRHPHVFPDGTLASRVSEQSTAVAEVKQSWEAIKASERQQKAQHSVLDDVPVSLPALTRAAKLQKRAARVGFDWDQLSDVIAAIKEELAEVEAASQAGNRDDIVAEVGDLLFCCVNLARHLNVDPETAVRSCNKKFERRFRYIEQQLKASGLSAEQASLQQMDALWDEAKAQGL